MILLPNLSVLGKVAFSDEYNLQTVNHYINKVKMLLRFKFFLNLSGNAQNR